MVCRTLNVKYIVCCNCSLLPTWALVFSRCCDKSNRKKASFTLCLHFNRQNCACLKPWWMFLILTLPRANLCFVVIKMKIVVVCASAVFLCTGKVRTWLAVNELSASRTKGRFTHSMPCPFHVAKGLECVSHLIYTVRPCLIHTCHAMPMPRSDHAVLLMATAQHGRR